MVTHRSSASGALSAIDYVDSGGINVLFARAGDMRLIVKPLLLRVLVVSGLSELTSVESAPGG